MKLITEEILFNYIKKNIDSEIESIDNWKKRDLDTIEVIYHTYIVNTKPKTILIKIKDLI